MERRPVRDLLELSVGDTITFYDRLKRRRVGPFALQEDTSGVLWVCSESYTSVIRSAHNHLAPPWVSRIEVHVESGDAGAFFDEV